MFRAAAATLLLIRLTWAQTDQGCRIRIVAGSPTADAGDGGPATAAQLSGASAAAFDRDGKLYIADTYNHKIRRVAVDGTISTFAGTGVQDSSGDGGPPSAATLNLPTGIASDRAGNVYIAESHGFRVRRVGPDGAIHTVAGTGVRGFNGDGPAAASQLGYLADLAADSAGNVFINDSGNYRVRRLSACGVLATVAGTGTFGDLDRGVEDGTVATAAAIAPRSIALDPSGVLYLGGLYSIWKIDPDGLLRRVAGNGSSGFPDPHPGDDALRVALRTDAGIAIDRAGALYFADFAKQRIGVIGSDGKFAGFIDARPLAIRYLAIADGFLLGGDVNRIFRYSADSPAQLLAGTAPFGFAGDGGPANAALLNNPQGIAFDSQGNLFVADANNRRVRRLSPDGVIATWAGTGTAGSDGDGSDATAATLNLPLDVAVDSADNLYIADELKLRRVAPDRTISSVQYKGEPPPGPWRVIVDSADDIYQAEFVFQGVAIVQPPDNVPQSFRLALAGAPTRIDSFLRSPNGGIAALAGDGLWDFSLPLPPNQLLPTFSARIFDRATRAAADPAGNFWVWDFYGLRRLEPDGALARILPFNFSDSFWPPARPPLIDINGLAIDRNGSIFLAGDSRVRVLERPDLCPASYPPSIAGVENFLSGSAVSSASPGQVIRIRGANLGPAQTASAQPDNGRYGTSLAGVSLTIGGIDAPVLSASRREIAAVVPFNAPLDLVPVVVKSGTGDMLSSYSISIAAASPGLSPDVRNEDGSSNSSANPARAGTIITLQATGLGLLQNAVADGQVRSGDPLPELAEPVYVTIGGRGADIVFAGAAPGQVAGIMQVRVRVPEDVNAGDALPIQLYVEGIYPAYPQIMVAVR